MHDAQNRRAEKIRHFVAACAELPPPLAQFGPALLAVLYPDLRIKVSRLEVGESWMWRTAP
jgi:hypothetical protein